MLIIGAGLKRTLVECSVAKVHGKEGLVLARLLLELRKGESVHLLRPLVGQSDLAFRLLCRRHGADLVYTQMLDAARFAVRTSVSLRPGFVGGGAG